MKVDNQLSWFDLLDVTGDLQIEHKNYSSLDLKEIQEKNPYCPLCKQKYHHLQANDRNIIDLYCDKCRQIVWGWMPC